MQDQYTGPPQNANDYAVNTYVDRSYKDMGISEEPAGSGEFPTEYEVFYVCPVTNAGNVQEVGLGFKIKFELSHSVETPADAEAVYKKVAENIQKAEQQIIVPASEEISHQNVTKYIQDRLTPDIRTAYGVTADVKVTAARADMTTQPGTVFYTTDISVPYSDGSRPPYQGPPLEAKALPELSSTRPEATFKTASDDNINSLAKGKTAADLIDGEIKYTAVSKNPRTIKVTGSLKPNDWEDFSTEPSLRKGYYLPITIVPSADNIEIAYKSSDAAIGVDTINRGRTIIVYVTPAKSPITITLTEYLDEFKKKTTYTLDLTELTLIPLPQATTAPVMPAQSAPPASKTVKSPKPETAQPI